MTDRWWAGSDINWFEKSNGYSVRQYNAGTLYVGNALDVLPTLEANSIHAIITSPPYYGLRDYGLPPVVWPDGWEGCLGLEPTPMQYVTHLVEILDACRRILRPDGTLWLNLGDSYARNSRVRWDNTMHTVAGWKCSQASRNSPDCRGYGIKPKNLLGIPWRVAFALQDAGWFLRSDIVWHKPNPMPESVRDRPTRSHEYIFLLSKSGRYFYDNEAIKEPSVMKPQRRPRGRPTDKIPRPGQPKQSWPTAKRTEVGVDAPDGKRNKRDVWTVATRPSKIPHFAVFPPDLIRPCILAATSERGYCSACGAPWVRVIVRRDHVDTGAKVGGDPTRGDAGGRERAHSGGGNVLPTKSVARGWRPSCDCGAPTNPGVILDPFFGAGTTALVCQETGRRWVGIEQSETYADIAAARLGYER